MQTEKCPKCHALEWRLKAIGVEYLCATQQPVVERKAIDALRKQLDEAEALFDQHLATHAARNGAS